MKMTKEQLNTIFRSFTDLVDETEKYYETVQHIIKNEGGLEELKLLQEVYEEYIYEMNGDDWWDYN